MHLEMTHMRLFTLLFLTCLTLTSAGQTVQHNVTIATSADDVEQQGEFIDLNDLELDLGYTLEEPNEIGLFFNDVILDKDAPIFSARIRMVLQSELLGDSLRALIYLENAAYPSRYTDTAGITEGRTYLSSFVDWTIPGGSPGDTVYTPDLSSLISEVVALEDWSPSAHLNFHFLPEFSGMVTDSTSWKAEFYSFDQNDPMRRPTLVIETDQGSINGVEDVTIENSIWLFPNPASDILNWKYAHQVEDIQIQDLTGRTVKSITYPTAQSIEISNLPAGNYVVIFSWKEGTDYERLIIR